MKYLQNKKDNAKEYFKISNEGLRKTIDQHLEDDVFNKIYTDLTECLYWNVIDKIYHIVKK